VTRPGHVTRAIVTPTSTNVRYDGMILGFDGKKAFREAVRHVACPYLVSQPCNHRVRPRSVS